MSDFMNVAAEPETLLGRHRVLSPTAGVLVSPLCLGTMTFGDAQESTLGICTEETSTEILDTFFNAGGNFIDTANCYQDQETETRLGHWLTARQNRESLVLATKYTMNADSSAPRTPQHRSNTFGNGAKSLRASLAGSLARLQTSYIDVLYVHWWDCSTSIEELMHALNREVLAGRVLYLGLSDSPAWVAARANAYARAHALRPFSLYQGLWNAAERDIEREVVPLCVADGMAVVPWRALGGGAFARASAASSAGKASNAGNAGTDDAEDTARPKPSTHADGAGRTIMLANASETALLPTLADLARKRGTSVAAIALAYVRSSAPDVVPIVGTRTPAHLRDAIAALGVRLSGDEIGAVRAASGWRAGFPWDMFAPGVASPIDVGAGDFVSARSQVRVDVGCGRGPAFAPQAG